MIEVNVPNMAGLDFKQQTIIFDKAYKRFKKFVEKEGVIKEVQDRRYYTKTSDVERRKQRERERNNGR